MAKGETDDIKIIARNRKALKDYEIQEKFEAGIALLGTEVKALRSGKINIADAYAIVENGQVILRNLHISPYEMAGHENHEPTRPRRLLLHKREIRKLKVQTEQKGMTLVPLMIYFRRHLVKVELALGMGRKKYDKREAIAKAEAKRRMEKAVKRNY